MTDMQIARLGILANLLFWPLMFAMAAMRSDYSHLHQAISELGSLGAPWMMVWNVFGFFGPGLLLAGFGWNLVRRLRPGSRWVAGILALAGIGMSFAGVFPANMDDREGWETMLHALGSLTSLLSWAAGVIATAILAHRTRPDIAAASCIAILAALCGFALYGFMPHTPALVQRINFGVFFGWYFVVALLLIVRRHSAPMPNG
ncbi:MAG: DUF998 domain-containing protein [Gemmatimonadetes bacterium]|nr:DUF998 domain-containing protein [Gemmatimonadota bacterium]MBM4190757.1 DUF998 domain-containing protein [Gemmatimonadota bacterium]